VRCQDDLDQFRNLEREIVRADEEITSLLRGLQSHTNSAAGVAARVTVPDGGGIVRVATVRAG